MMTLFDEEQILKAYTKDIVDNATHKEAVETAERLIRKGIIRMLIHAVPLYPNRILSLPKQ